IQREELRHDPGQQPLGRIEREGPHRRARRAGHEGRGHREVRGQRRRRGTAALAPEGRWRRLPVPRRQRRAFGAGGEVARPHGLEAAERVALGTDGPAIREGYYKIDRYEGLIKTYSKPFTPDNHDAVNENDYVWTQFIDNQIVPVGMKK